MTPLVLVLLALLGAGVGVFGTLVGAGGGFILTPVLLIVYPGLEPAAITAMSLAVVFCNAASGSAAYARQRRIDYRSGLVFAAATLPGAVLGALVVTVVPRVLFDPVMALLLGALAVWLLAGAGRPGRPGAATAGVERRLVDRDGNEYVYRVRTRLGAGLSVLIGFLSSFLGIGGGIVHVPVLVQVLGVPVHVATATSHFVLAIMAAVGTFTHILHGDFTPTTAGQTLALSAGVVLGAQVGAHLSQRTSAPLIKSLLALALLSLAIRLIVGVVAH